MIGDEGGKPTSLKWHPTKLIHRCTWKRRNIKPKEKLFTYHCWTWWWDGMGWFLRFPSQQSITNFLNRILILISYDNINFEFTAASHVRKSYSFNTFLYLTHVQIKALVFKILSISILFELKIDWSIDFKNSFALIKLKIDTN